jgi:hypothetical protein
MEKTIQSQANPCKIIEERRLGKFQIDKKTVLNYPHLVTDLLSHVLVTKCDFLFHEDAFLYYGYSTLFETIEQYSDPPKYGIYFECISYEDKITPVELFFCFGADYRNVTEMSQDD